MDWTLMGASPPTSTHPTLTCRVFRRVESIFAYQYPRVAGVTI